MAHYVLYALAVQIETVLGTLSPPSLDIPDVVLPGHPRQAVANRGAARPLKVMSRVKIRHAGQRLLPQRTKERVDFGTELYRVFAATIRHMKNS